MHESIRCPFFSMLPHTLGVLVTLPVQEIDPFFSHQRQFFIFFRSLLTSLRDSSCFRPPLRPKAVYILGFCSSLISGTKFVLVIYCCLINHPQISWLKATNSFSLAALGSGWGLVRMAHFWSVCCLLRQCN